MRRYETEILLLMCGGLCSLGPIHHGGWLRTAGLVLLGAAVATLAGIAFVSFRDAVRAARQRRRRFHVWITVDSSAFNRDVRKAARSLRKIGGKS